MGEQEIEIDPVNQFPCERATRDGWSGVVASSKVSPRRAAIEVKFMVGVAQLVEPWIVIPVVVGSSPIIHPIFQMSIGFSQN